MWLVYKTSRFSYRNKTFFEEGLNSHKPLIVCFWHQRLFLLPFAWQWKHKKFYMLLSPHADGLLIGKILSFFKINCIFGSTYQNAEKAAIQIYRHLKKGDIIGITPDGPRGPHQKAQIGIAQLALLTKANILPLTYHINSYKKLNSWDRFLFPFPFSKGFFLCGKLIDAENFMDKNELLQEIEKQLNFITNNEHA